MDEIKIRVAIVGTGMAGLVTAHLLAQDPRQRYQITIFEKVSRLFLVVFLRLHALLPELTTYTGRVTVS